MKIEKENIVFGLDKEDKIKISNLLDKYFLYEKKKIPSYSNFLNLRELALWESRVKNKNIVYKVVEKIPDCEKKVLWFGPLSEGDDVVTIYRGKCQTTIKHQEVLGSLFAIGLNSNTIGDIVVEDDYFYFTNLTKLNSFVEENLIKVGNKKVSLAQVEEVPITKNRYHTIEIIVNSLRLDIIVSKLANISRKNSLDKLKNHEIYVNFKEQTKSTYLLKEEDILSIRRVGKFKVGKVLSTTKKDKMILEIKKYN